MYSEQELKPWVEKVDKIRKQTKTLRVYFNNHYGGEAVVDELQFKFVANYYHRLSKKSGPSNISPLP
ncbi:MAG: DUF72 domain-containing protein [Candidatus Nitrosopolaris sp.]